MRLNTEEEAGCKRGGPPTVATPRLRSRPFSPQLISARGARLRTFFGVHLEVEYGRGGGGGEEKNSSPTEGGKGRGGKGRKGAQDYPRALLRSHQERAGPERPALGPPFLGRRRASRGAAHTPAGAPRGRRDTSRRPRKKGLLTAASRAQQQQHHQGPHRGRRGVAAGAAAGVWSSHRSSHRQDLPPPPSQAGPAAAVRHWQDPPPRLPGRAHARSCHPPPPPVRSPPTLPLSRRAIRARALAPAPPPGLLTRSPSALRARVRAPVCFDEVWIPLPRNGTRWTCGSRPATLHSPPPRCIRQPPQEAERVFLRLPGTSLPPPSPRFSRASHTTQGPVPSLQRSSSALSLPPSRFRSAAWRCAPPTWASPPTRAPPAASSPEPVPAPPNCRLGPPIPQRERTRVGASLRFRQSGSPGRLSECWARGRACLRRGPARPLGRRFGPPAPQAFVSGAVVGSPRAFSPCSLVCFSSEQGSSSTFRRGGKHL
ncbi:serine/arginine repetitive matrix protein 1-like [Prionailurus viverrinus]|uniref:serine/arginine repetitive matrix protein 1-like n=1 Tax=Prionailurus viverrinus TaxID=61388 RepID=UPI001FF5AA41|nr:serine/arginine repetitive matrix protein 1-like [Prionailurus viverrinus]XP_047732339.1 serine/arginine repetitive matrix protein 1-like [Prionailurus viverrinus]XP_047732340.1 serine/arginine repetitive matrix protein 1-like [Prionailurus viverrinus]XP_047732341.1 serine/arginine repetitive matrix protein 1-like [Prionailurus viverrinus]XP_047732342.1 serine/arginine repetitive matrix protein 1-like [Prionailurus viverrinus]XP_047732343.1 serine/arginine repetitive matrix protein 1-like [